MMALPPEQFRRLHDAAVTQEARKREEGSWFNQPEALADYRYWARQPYWTSDEGLLLVHSRDPRRIDMKRLLSCADFSPFAARVRDDRQIVERAIVLKQIGSTNPPGFFVAWAKRWGLTVDPGLEPALAELSIEVRDWVSLCQAQLETIQKLESTAQQLAEENDALGRHRDDLLAELDALRARGGGNREIGTRETDSLLKLLIGMAVGGYRYDPQAGRNDATREIADDLVSLGLDLSRDTILKWLRQGADLLPSQHEGD